MFFRWIIVSISALGLFIQSLIPHAAKPVFPTYQIDSKTILNNIQKATPDPTATPIPAMISTAQQVNWSVQKVNQMGVRPRFY